MQDNSRVLIYRFANVMITLSGAAWKESTRNNSYCLP